MTFRALPKDVRQGELDTAQNWDSLDLLKRSVEERKKSPTYVFYDGPPTANGNPGIHHVIARTLKDLTCRYKTMKGFRVRRKAGWDTHGLPVEIEVEKQLGLSDKKEIEEYGIAAFNEKCRESVFRYRDQWMEMSKRMAFLADMENPYITLKNEYIETEWHLLKDFFDRGLIYKGAKILPYCPRCGTGLASHEVAQGYQEDEVTTVIAKFAVKGEENTYFLAWTTTPWTLPSNVALTVHPEVTYVKVRQGEETYYLAEALMEAVLLKERGEVEILEKMTGKELEYKEYEQLLPFVSVRGKAFFVTCTDYVTTEDGTGIVHTAPAFGEDDYQTGMRYKLPIICPVAEDGTFTEGPHTGKFVIDCDPEIIEYLREQGKMYRKQKFVHNYPHCWRCHSPLIYYSKPSWYIETTKFRDQLIANNNTVNWYPGFVGEKRFGNWLENLKDWALSRSRYWGTPLNIWTCEDCDHHEAIGSRKELAEKAIEDIDETIELHRPYVDDVHLRCPKCGGLMHRESDVIDVWFDSGAMPFAQWHYPFENQDDFEESFPADFISEGIDQTRGWFYVLMAISTLYKGVSPYKNVLVNDMILDAKGQKMSKSRGNTLDPIRLFDEYGADAVRFYSLYVSPPWQPTRFDVEGLKEVNAKFFRTMKNVHAMFVMYANTNQWDPRKWSIAVSERPEIDRWLLSEYNKLLAFYHEQMDAFEYTKVVRALSDFVVEDLSNWYVRRNRRRFWASEETLENRSVFLTTYEVLLGLAKMIAPITPFLAEQIYQSLTNGEAMESVHLELLDNADESLMDSTLSMKMELVRKIVNLGRASREEAGIKVRQPLSRILLETKLEPVMGDLSDLIEEELNVKEVVFTEEMEDLMDVQLKPDFRVAGRILGAKIKAFTRFLQEQNQVFVKELEQHPVMVELDGEEVSIVRDYVQVDYRAKEGFDVAMSEEVRLALDTTLSESLIQEGYMREFISKVQQMRKSNGYETTDRIHIRYHVDREVREALEKYQERIQAETLALSMTEQPLDAEEIDLNGHPLQLELQRA